MADDKKLKELLHDLENLSSVLEDRGQYSKAHVADKAILSIKELAERIETLEASCRVWEALNQTKDQKLEAAQGVVKPLEWDQHPDEQEWYAKLEEQEGDTFERGYMILSAQSHFTLYDGFASRARVLGHYTLAPDAKAAAQADYERRILSAFTTPPADTVAEAEAIVELTVRCEDEPDFPDKYLIVGEARSERCMKILREQGREIIDIKHFVQITEEHIRGHEEGGQ